MQGELFPTRPLYEAVRPRGHRDEAGTTGELIHKLADICERYELEMPVLRHAPHRDVWYTLRKSIVAHNRRSEIVAGQFRTLRALRKFALKH
jgi:hypothetical protein